MWKNKQIADLRALVPDGEELLAWGLATGVALVVTDRRIIRFAHPGPVSVPFEAVRSVEVQSDAHQWIIRLFHDPIDPRRSPADATQWWRWHDRRRYAHETAKAARVTELCFSRRETKASLAIMQALDERAVHLRVLPPAPRTPRSELRFPKLWGRRG